MAATYLCNSSVQSYHVYQGVWSAEENLMCKQEMSNLHDSYAVVVVKGKQTCQSALAVYLLVDRTVPGPLVFVLAPRLSADKTFRFT